jgi:hypothetical protein
MENISTIQLSFFLMASLVMISSMMTPFMTSLGTRLKRHGRKIEKKNP